MIPYQTIYISLFYSSILYAFILFHIRRWWHGKDSESVGAEEGGKLLSSPTRALHRPVGTGEARGQQNHRPYAHSGAPRPTSPPGRIPRCSPLSSSLGLGVPPRRVGALRRCCAPLRELPGRWTPWARGAPFLPGLRGRDDERRRGAGLRAEAGGSTMSSAAT